MVCCVFLGPQNHRKENTNHLRTYAEQLSSLSEKIRGSSLFTSFFESPGGEKTRAVKMADASTSPRSSLRHAGPDVQHLHNSGSMFNLHFQRILRRCLYNLNITLVFINSWSVQLLYMLHSTCVKHRHTSTQIYGCCNVPKW